MSNFLIFTILMFLIVLGLAIVWTELIVRSKDDYHIDKENMDFP